MVENNFQIKEMTQAQLDIAFAWGLNEGWILAQSDAECYFKIDPEGFLMGFYNGEPAASTAAVKYGEKYGFLGFLIVNKKYRNMGFGYKMWLAGLKRLEGRTIGADVPIDKTKMLQRAGFNQMYRNLCFRGIGAGKSEITNSNIVPVTDFILNDVINYDRKFFLAERENFIKCLINSKNNISLCYIENGSNVRGYSILRHTNAGYHFAPLFADNPFIAKCLLETLVSYVPNGQKFYIDVPELNAQAIELLYEFEAKIIYETQRMYSGDSLPKLPVDKVYGITSLEVG